MRILLMIAVLIFPACTSDLVYMENPNTGENAFCGFDVCHLSHAANAMRYQMQCVQDYEEIGYVRKNWPSVTMKHPETGKIHFCQPSYGILDPIGYTSKQLARCILDYGKQGYVAEKKYGPAILIDPKTEKIRLCGLIGWCWVGVGTTASKDELRKVKAQCIKDYEKQGFVLP